MADDTPRCPLGFTGTPPAGHPTMPGMRHGSASKASSSSSSSHKLIDTLEAYRPSTLLIIDALFLGLCVIAAIYRDDIKAYWTSMGKTGGQPSGNGKR